MEFLVSVLPIVAIFAVFWLLVLRPASNRQKKLAAVQRSLEVGDSVITSSGFFGTVRSFDGDKVGLEVAEGVVITVARGAVVGKPDEDAAAAAPSADDEPRQDDEAREGDAAPTDPTADDRDR